MTIRLLSWTFSDFRAAYIYIWVKITTHFGTSDSDFPTELLVLLKLENWSKLIEKQNNKIKMERTIKTM